MTKFAERCLGITLACAVLSNHVALVHRRAREQMMERERQAQSHNGSVPRLAALQLGSKAYF